MKLKIQKKILDKRLDTTSVSIDSSNFHQPMRGLVLEVLEHKMILFGSDGELSISNELIADNDTLTIERPGKVLIPNIMFRNIVKKASGLIELEVVNNILKIKNNLDEYSINLFDIDNYPNIEFNKYGTSFEIQFEVFKNLIRNTAFAASSSESAQKVLHYVNFSGKDGLLRVSATDSFRLATEVTKIPEVEEFEVSLPVKSLRKILSIELEGDAKIYIEDRKFNIELNDLTIQMKVFDGIYIDLSNIFPKDLNSVLQIEKRELNDMLSKAAFSSSDKYNRVKMSFSESDFSISSIYEEVGSSIVRCKNFVWKGGDLVITINYRFLKEAVSVFDGKIAVFFNNKADRIVVLSKSNENNKQLVTPHRG